MCADKQQGGSILLVVEGLFEKSDSIGYDCVYQYNTMKVLFPRNEVKIFARKYDSSLHNNVNIEDINRLYEDYRDTEDATIIYHFCDGWASFESWLIEFPGRVVVRWHNNTPPWFFIHSRDYADRTVRGYEHILRLSSRDRLRIWCNSEFSVRQLVNLNVDKSRCSIVYPGSRYLDKSHHDLTRVEPSGQDPEHVKIAFVGRVVPHKGHRHVLLAASAFQRLTGNRIEVYFAGRIAVEDYIEELRGLAKSSNVEMHVLDEVSEKDLLALYKSVRCLLYLSEHEGFGLPIYEAMSVGVPVIAWRATAVEEIMYHHPLALDRMEYDRIAARIALLSSSKLKSEIVDIQNNHILPCYSTERIKNQIMAACVGDSLEADRPKCSSAIREQIELAIDGVLDNVSPDVPLRSVPKEIKGNFVTLHDLAAYRALLKDDFTYRLARESDNGNQYVTLPISRFSRRGGLQSNGSLVFDLHAARGHLIFGPFLKLPAGNFSVRFLVDVADLPERSGVMRFETATVDRCLVGVETYCDDFRDRWAPELQFSLESPLEQVEFRVSVTDWAQGTLRFSGVEVRKILGLDEIVETFNRTPDIKVDYKPKKPWPWLFQPAGAGVEHAKGASRHRELGDAARDRERWPEALAHYKRHLKEHPSDVQILIQAGNCAKESTRFREAERFYDAALSILPTDVDINVQLGHLAKLRGRESDAASFFARALNLGRGAFDAERELRDIGARR